MTEFRDFEATTLKGRRVGNRARDMLSVYANQIDESKSGLCRVYWGMHGCNLKRRHSDYQHKCFCGCTPNEWSVIWGEDMSPEEYHERPYLQKALRFAEEEYSRNDLFDKNGKYRGPGYENEA